MCRRTPPSSLHAVALLLCVGTAAAAAVATVPATATTATTATAATSEGGCTCDGTTTDCSYRNMATVRSTDLCANTTIIEMQGNNMVEFPEGMQRFAVIMASENRLARLPAASQLGRQARVLDLSRNAIANSSRELGAASQLRIVRVQHNFLASLDFLPRACGLYVLDASNNSLSNLEGPLQDCTRLVFLSLAKNQLATVPSGAFYRLKKLKDLFLDSNMIESVSEGAFRGLRSLRRLSLARNLLTWVPEEMLRSRVQLLTLDLSGNGLSALPAALFDATPRLQVLDLHANQLLALPSRLFFGLPALRELQVWKNRLTELPDLSESCPLLEVANFDSNNLTEASQEAQRTLLNRLQGRSRK